MSNWLTDIRAVTIRNLIRFRSTADVFVWAVLQPIMFVLLFSQVFGGAIKVPGVDYTNFLMAGIFAQTAVFGATFSGMFMIQDRKDGLLDRFKTLPMSNSAVLIARTIADLTINTVSLSAMVITGLIVGWRPEAGIGGFIGGMALLLAFSWAFSWVLIWVGMKIKSAEAFNSATFMVMFPLTFLSNAFVPVDTLPTWLQTFVNVNPVSHVVSAVRDLANDGVVTSEVGWALLGCLVVIAVFAPLAVRSYQREQ